MSNLPMSDALEESPQHSRPSAGASQIAKYCVVGLSGAVIDKGSLWLLLEKILPRSPWWLCATIAFCLAVTNNFFWNRHWTFQAHGEGHASARHQYIKFFATNIVGWMLNLVITNLFLIPFTGQLLHPIKPPSQHVLIASLCAAPFVSLWNFFAAKHWTFKKFEGA